MKNLISIIISLACVGAYASNKCDEDIVIVEASSSQSKTITPETVIPLFKAAQAFKFESKNKEIWRSPVRVAIGLVEVTGIEPATS